MTEVVETTVEEMIEDSTETTEDVETIAEEMTDATMIETVAIGIVLNVTTQTLHSEQSATDVESQKVPAVETTVVAGMTAEEMTEVTKAETDKVGDSRETTAAMMIEVEGTGIVQNATTQTLHSEQSATDVESQKVPAVETIVGAGMTAEEMTVDSRTVIDKEGVSREMITEGTTEEEEIGIVQNAATRTLLSEQSVTNVDYHATVEMTEAVVETIADVETIEEAMFVGAAERLTTTMIGNVQSVKTQTLHLEQSVTAAAHLVQVVVDVGHAEMMVEDLLVVMTVPEHPVVMMVEDLPVVMMVEDLLVVMAETEGVKVAMKIEAHTAKNGLNADRRNLEHLENHVAMAQAMHITDLQNQSADVKMTTREGRQWVLNITTSMP